MRYARVLVIGRRLDAEQLTQAPAESGKGLRRRCHELVEVRRPAALCCRQGGIDEQTFIEARRDVDNLIPDGDTDPWRVVSPGSLEHAEREVLYWEVAPGRLRRLDPGRKL